MPSDCTSERPTCEAQGLASGVTARRRVVVLPGFDGSPALLAGFARSAPAWAEVTVWGLPDEPVASYADLAAHFRPRLRDVGPCLLLAESFSGPAAVLLAGRAADTVRGLVLCNSFIRRPPLLPPLAPWWLLARVAPPRPLVRGLMTGGDDAVAGQVVAALREVRPRTLAAQFRLLATADVRREFAALAGPVLLLHGTRDRLVGPGALTLMRRTLPRAAVVELPAPHLAWQTQPAAAWAGMAAFLSAGRA